MSRMPTHSTKPEMALRRLLHQAGLRYRVNSRVLPGRPDIALTRARIAVFVDGCFWHGCPRHSPASRMNSEWWRRKLERNRARDEETTARLTARGWAVVRVWEHANPDAAADLIHRLVTSRRTQDVSHLSGTITVID